MTLRFWQCIFRDTSAKENEVYRKISKPIGKLGNLARKAGPVAGLLGAAWLDYRALTEFALNMGLSYFTIHANSAA